MGEKHTEARDKRREMRLVRRCRRKNGRTAKLHKWEGKMGQLEDSQRKRKLTNIGGKDI